MDQTRKKDRQNNLQNHLSADICSTMESQLESDLTKALYHIRQLLKQASPVWGETKQAQKFLDDHS